MVQVRDACLVALGLTNNAMLVHDAIVHRLESTHTNAEKVVAARLAVRCTWAVEFWLDTGFCVIAALNLIVT